MNRANRLCPPTSSRWYSTIGTGIAALAQLKSKPIREATTGSFVTSSRVISCSNELVNLTMEVTGVVGGAIRSVKAGTGMPYT